MEQNEQQASTDRPRPIASRLLRPKPTEDLIALTRSCSPLPSAKSGIDAVEIVTAVTAREDGHKIESIWDAISTLIERGDMERLTVFTPGEHYRYRLTKQGETNLPPAEISDQRMDKIRHEFISHKGKAPCPKCKGLNTASSVAKATFPVIPGFCFDCNRRFKIAAKKIGAYIELPKKEKPNQSTNQVEQTKKGKRPEGDSMSSLTMAELKKKSVADLTKIYNDKKPEGAKAIKFSTKDKALKVVAKILGVENGSKPAAKAEKKSAPKKSAKEKGPSKFDMIRDHFKSHKTATQEFLAKLTGFDAANVHTAMSILKNKTRTKPENMVITEYDREKKTYTKTK